MPVIVNRALHNNCLKICIGDLNRKVTLELRSILPPEIGATEPTMVFSIISRFWCQVDTISESRRFSGVVTEDKITHMFVTSWKSNIDRLDGDGEYFIRMKNKRNSNTTLYRIEGIGDHNEQNKWIAFLCSERGLEGKEGSNA